AVRGAGAAVTGPVWHVCAGERAAHRDVGRFGAGIEPRAPGGADAACDSRAAEEGAEVEPAALLRDVHDDLGAAVPLQKLDPGGVDELAPPPVVGGQLD